MPRTAASSAPPARTRSEPVPANREEEILAAAGRLFGQRGFDLTSLRDISTQLGITKAALYYYFPDKQALYERVVIGGLKALLEHTEASVRKAHTPVGRVRAFMLGAAEFLDAHRWTWLSASGAFWSDANGKRRALAIGIRDRFEALLRSCIAEAIRSGDFRRVDPAMAGRLLLSAINYLPRWQSPDGALSAAQIVEQYLDFTLHGMLKPERGHAQASRHPTIHRRKVP